MQGKLHYLQTYYQLTSAEGQVNCYRNCDRNLSVVRCRCRLHRKLLSTATRPIPTKLGTMYHWLKRIQMKGHTLFPIGYEIKKRKFVENFLLTNH